MGTAKEAGARYVMGSALRLGPAARQRFLPVLNQEFAELAERYSEHYARSDSTSRAYQAALERRLHELQQVHGFPVEGTGRRQRAEGRPHRKDPARLQASLL
jgi:hypothetical protein